jgi:hypothetical protein
MNNSVEAKLNIGERAVKNAQMHYIAENPETEITPANIGCFEEKVMAVKNNIVTIPKAAVAAIEIEI